MRDYRCNLIPGIDVHRNGGIDSTPVVLNSTQNGLIFLFDVKKCIQKEYVHPHCNKIQCSRSNKITKSLLEIFIIAFIIGHPKKTKLRISQKPRPKTQFFFAGYRKTHRNVYCRLKMQGNIRKSWDHTFLEISEFWHYLLT